MNLSRTKRGTMIHTRDCRHARNGVPWLWADDKSVHEVIRWAEYAGYQTCLHCKPLPGTVIRRIGGNWYSVDAEGNL